MNGQERRKQIIDYISKCETPVSGKQLADLFQVTRQVIVQDIALIRANGCDIISTNKGYIVHMSNTASRIFCVNHTDEELEEELCMIVDMGGKVVNVIVEHQGYGRLEAELNITSRRRVQELMEDMKAIFRSALDFMVPEEQLDAASKVSNAILENTDITINHAKDDICNITVKYPNVAKALKEEEEKLAADATQEEIDVMLQNLTDAINNGEVEIIEKTMDVTIIEVEEFKTIQWTTELYDAITGGLYSIE